MKTPKQLEKRISRIEDMLLQLADDLGSHVNASGFDRRTTEATAASIKAAWREVSRARMYDFRGSK